MKLFGISRKKHLQPNEYKIYNTITSLTNTIKRITAHKNNLADRLHEAEKYIKNNKTLDILNQMLGPAKDFFISHLRNFGKNKYKRTYTFEDKALALALYKKSPKTYHFMAEIFYLPSKELLRKVVKNITLKSGICDIIFEEIEARVTLFDDEKYKYCILMFDEMKLDASLVYIIQLQI